jgi:hypothetical protein
LILAPGLKFLVTTPNSYKSYKASSIRPSVCPSRPFKLPQVLSFPSRRSKPCTTEREKDAAYSTRHHLHIVDVVHVCTPCYVPLFLCAAFCTL